MPTEFPDSKVLKGLHKKVEEEITRKEIESLLYWKTELEKVTARHSDNLAALRLEIQSFLQRMQNRIKILKGNLPG